MPRRSTTSCGFTPRTIGPTTRYSSWSAISIPLRRRTGSSVTSERFRKPAGNVPRVTLVEPPQTAERTIDYRAANVPLPAVDYAYHIPAANTPDGAALDLAETILGAGKSSRLYHSLVYGKQLATSAYARADLREHPGLFEFSVVLSRGSDVADAREALDAEIARLRGEPVSLQEMRTRENTDRQLVRARPSNVQRDRALALVRAAIERNDPGAVNTDLARYLAVTAEDVQRVADDVFTRRQPHRRRISAAMIAPVRSAARSERSAQRHAADAQRTHAAQRLARDCFRAALGPQGARACR